MLLLNVLLALAWVALTGQFTPINLALGFALGHVMLWVSERARGPDGYFTVGRRFLAFVAFLVWELVKANLQVSYHVLAPPGSMRPAVMAVPLEARSDVEITLLANLVTLTPGTLALDVSADRRVMYVHSMTLGDDPERFRARIKDGFERRVLELLR